MTVVDSLRRFGKSTATLRGVLVVAVAIRILLPISAFIFSQGNPQFHARDTRSYIDSAQGMISEGEFSRWGEPEILRTPGYPLLLLPGIVFGNLETVTISLQIMLSTLTVFLVYRITMLLFGRQDIAIVSALFLTFDPTSILYSSKLMSETLFAALLTSFAYLLLRYWNTRSLPILMLSALALASATYVRPIAYYLPALIFVVLFAWLLATKRLSKQGLVHLFIFLLLSAVPIGLWQVRNRIETGYGGFSAAVEHSMYFWDAASVLAVHEGIPLGEMQERMGLNDWETYFGIFPDQRGFEIGDIYKFMGKEGLAIILQNPGTYGALVLKGAIRTLIDPAATEYLRMFRLYPENGGLVDLITDQGLAAAIVYLFDERPRVLVANLLLAPVVGAYILLGLFGAIQVRIASMLPIAVISTLTIYLLVLSAAGIGTSRARHPIMPLLCIFAGYGTFRIATAIRTRWELNRDRSIQTASIQRS